MIVDEWNRQPLDLRGAISFHVLISYQTFVTFFGRNICNFDVDKFDNYIIKRIR